MPKIPIALTIAGSDPTSGAGIQADLKTFEAHGVYGLSVITALTAQNTNGVQSVYPIPVGEIQKQCESLIEDIPFKVIKTGMIYDAEAAEYIAAFIATHDLLAIVDTPFISSSGMKLAQDDAVEIFFKKLIPNSMLVTPNIFEAERLSGVQIWSRSDMEQAAAKILCAGANAVFIKGGHLRGIWSPDLFLSPGEKVWFDSERVDANPHGTGCALSAAITANLALGYTLVESVKNSKEYITEAIRNSISIGHGRNVLSHSSLIMQV